ncbi:luciferase family protein [Actinoallomurus liliacearum]
MRETTVPATSYADRAMARVASWPGVRSGRAACGLGTALKVGGRQLAHVHADGCAELRLTWPVIGRLRRPLLESGRVQLAPGGDWIRVRLDTDGDVDLFASLASVAIKANTSAGRRRTAGACMTMAQAKVKEAMRSGRPAAVPDDLREPRLRTP